MAEPLIGSEEHQTNNSRWSTSSATEKTHIQRSGYVHLIKRTLQFNPAHSHHTAALCSTASLQTPRWPCGFPPALSLPLPLHPWSLCPVCKWNTNWKTQRHFDREQKGFFFFVSSLTSMHTVAKHCRQEICVNSPVYWTPTFAFHISNNLPLSISLTSLSTIEALHFFNTRTTASLLYVSANKTREYCLNFHLLSWLMARNHSTEHYVLLILTKYMYISLPKLCVVRCQRPWTLSTKIPQCRGSCQLKENWHSEGVSQTLSHN